MRDMRRRSLVKSSSNNSDYTRSGTDDSMELDTDLTDVNEFANNNNKNNNNTNKQLNESLNKL